MKWFSSKGRRILLFAGLSAGLLILLALAGISIFAKPFLAKQVATDSFREMLSRSVSKAIKVDGKFEPLKLEDWTAVTAGYSSTGWPGEAIASLDATNVRGTFRPSGILQGRWSVDPILIERGKFVLRTPDDALKRPPAPPGKRAWYANLMPQQFYTGWMDCAVADVEFPFAGGTSGMRNVHLGATMIGRDFKYYVNGGELVVPKLQPLAIDAAEIYVTREMVEVGYAYMRDPTGGPARLDLFGKMGMREDKSVDVKADFAALNFTAALPAAVQDSVKGEASGKVIFQSDKQGLNATGAGDLKLTHASFSNWGPLDDLARLHNNPSLRSFEFEDFQISYALKQDNFVVDSLELTVRDKIRLAGKLSYNLKTDVGSASLKFDQMPVKTWLPQDLKGLTDARVHGNLEWNGPVKDWENSTASGRLDLSGATIRNPVRGIGTLGKFSVRFPESAELKRATIAFGYSHRVFQATEIDIESPEFFKIKGSGSWNDQDRLQADIAFEFLSLSAWLPKALARQVSGDLRGEIKWECPKLELEKGSGYGKLELTGATLRDFDFQKFLARFHKSDEWLTMRLSEAELEWEGDGKKIEVKNINLFAKGKVGLRGSLTIWEGGKVRGKLLAGTTKAALDWLPDATSTVFSKRDDGLFWAEVEVSGTTDKLQTDLSPQVMTQLKKHPLSVAELGVKGLSWWLGDVLGTVPKEVEIQKKPKKKR